MTGGRYKKLFNTENQHYDSNPSFSPTQNHQDGRHRYGQGAKHYGLKFDRHGQTGGSTQTNTQTIPSVSNKMEELIGSRRMMQHDLLRKQLVVGSPTANSEALAYAGITNANEIELLSPPSTSSLPFSLLPTLGSSRTRPHDISTGAAESNNDNDRGVPPHSNVMMETSHVTISCGRQDEDLDEELSSLIFSSNHDADHDPPPLHPINHDHDPEGFFLVVGRGFHLTLSTEEEPFLPYPAYLGDDLSSLSDLEDSNNCHTKAAEEQDMNGSPLCASSQQEKEMMVESDAHLFGQSCQKLPTRESAIGAAAFSEDECSLTSLFLESACRSTSSQHKNKGTTTSEEPKTTAGQQQRNENKRNDHSKKEERDKLLLVHPPHEAQQSLLIETKGTRRSQRRLVRSKKKEATNNAENHSCHHVASNQGHKGKGIVVTEDDQDDDEGEQPVLVRQPIPAGKQNDRYCNNNFDLERNASEKKDVLLNMDQWYIQYQELVEYKTQHGHCNVPFRYKNDNPFLAAWVKRQRYQYKRKIRGKHSHLTDERERLLEGLGFVWDSHVAAWEENFSLMADFYEQHGHCCVPIKQKELRDWAKRQRRLYKHKQLLPSTTTTSACSTIVEDRIRRLHKIQFFQSRTRRTTTIRRAKNDVETPASHEK